MLNIRDPQVAMLKSHKAFLSVALVLSHYHEVSSCIGSDVKMFLIVSDELRNSLRVVTLTCSDRSSG